MVATSTDPQLGAIRLAWWRVRLEELDDGVEPPAEPRLQAVAAELVSRGISGSQLSTLEGVWRPLLEPFPWAEPQADAMTGRGQTLFDIGASLLGGNPTEAEAPGALWSLVDAAVHCSDAQSRDFLLDRAQAIALPGKSPPGVRSLTVLAVLAISNVLDPGSGLARGMAALRHRRTGRFLRWS